MAHSTFSTLQTLSDGFATLSANVWPSLVQIHNGRQGVGAGVIVREDRIRKDGVREDALIVTNAHVVAERSTGRWGNQPTAITVQLMDGRKGPAHVIAVDPDQDLAALTVELSALNAVTFADSRLLRAGDVVVALGFPWGVAGGVTSGVIIDGASYRHRAVAATASTTQSAWLTASLHLRPGHSGGPMVNSRGELIGINTMMNGPDVGVAIPAHTVSRFLEGIHGKPAAQTTYL